MLTVVQYQQDGLSSPTCSAIASTGSWPGVSRTASRVATVAATMPGIATGVELHPGEDALVGVARREDLDRRERQPRLAGATRPGQGEQPADVERADDLTDLGVPADERRGPHR